MFDITIALGIISFLLTLILSIVSYLYISQRRDMNHRMGRIEIALEANSDKDELNRKELEDKIEKHYAFKSDYINLKEIVTRIDDDLKGLREEAMKGNGLLAEVLVELRVRDK